MDKKQLQQMIIMMPIILIGGIFGYYKYLFSPLREKSKIVAEELRKIKQEYQESEARATRLPKLQQEIAVLNIEIKEIEKKLPPTKDVPDLIRLLSKKMETHNIRWKRLAPGTVTAKDYYIEHTYTIPFVSSYHNLALFLSEVGQMERIFATRFIGLRSTIDPRFGIQVDGELTFLIYTSKQ